MNHQLLQMNAQIVSVFHYIACYLGYEVHVQSRFGLRIYDYVWCLQAMQLLLLLGSRYIYRRSLTHLSMAANSLYQNVGSDTWMVKCSVVGGMIVTWSLCIMTI